MSALLDELSGSWTSLVPAALAGPLVVAGWMKLSTPVAELPWPVDRGPLRAPAGPRLVAAAELLVAASAIILPARSGAPAVALIYAALTVVAVALRGRRCACFGARRGKALGVRHIAANLLAAFIASAATAGGDADAEAGAAARGGTSLAAVVLCFAVVTLLDRRRAAPVPAPATACAEAVYAVDLYVSENCPSCRSLKQLVANMEPARRDAVRITVLEAGDELPDIVAGLGVPCAVGRDAGDQPACPSVDGIGQVKSLIDRVVIRPAATVDAA